MEDVELRELDLLVARKVMAIPGYLLHTEPAGKMIATPTGSVYHVAEAPHYSTNVGTAFGIVERLRSAGYYLGLTYKLGVLDDLSAFGWEAVFRGGNGLHCVAAAESPELAICRAALLVAEVAWGIP